MEFTPPSSHSTGEGGLLKLSGSVRSKRLAWLGLIIMFGIVIVAAIAAAV